MTSIKEHIIKYLEAEYGNKFCWSGVLARTLHELTGVKESAIERRARELVKSGVLEVVHEQVEGKGQKCAKYRVIRRCKTYEGKYGFTTHEPGENCPHIFENPKLL